MYCAFFGTNTKYSLRMKGAITPKLLRRLTPNFQDILLNFSRYILYLAFYKGYLS